MKRRKIPVCHANQIKLSYTIKRRKTYLIGARATYDFLMQIWDKELIELQCQYMAVFMDDHHYVLGWRCISTNSYKQRNLDMGLVVALAATTRSGNVLIAHNNPNGDLINTEIDDALYRKLVEVFSHLDCQLQDQMIISKEGYFSFVENNGEYL